MRVAYLDPVGGLSGDMWLAALLAAGLPLQDLRAFLQQIPGGLDLEARKVTKNGLSALTVSLTAREENAFPRTFPEVIRLVEQIPLTEDLRHLVQKAFYFLFKAEARVHGCRLEEVHLHEIAAFDTLGDILGVLYGLQVLKIEEVWVGPLPMGGGLTTSSHGPLPLPAPAALELLKGFELYGISEKQETVTPTGAALLQALEAKPGPLPPLKLTGIGIGAGNQHFTSRPNILRFLIGETTLSSPGLRWEQVVELETNLDDQSPEILAAAMQKLLQAGALDVGFSPFFMKKGRPGYRLCVLARPAEAPRLAQILLQETGSLGVRLKETTRFVVPREIRRVQTPWGIVHVKVARYGEKIAFKPEFEDMKVLAQRLGAPLPEAYGLVEAYLGQNLKEKQKPPSS